MMKTIRLGDYIDLLTDYHSGGSYKTLKEKTKILHKPDYAVMVRTLNFERGDFQKDLIYCDKASYDFLAYSHVIENDVLMNKIANPGSVYIMPKVDYPATCGMNLFLLRFKGINQRYLFYVMKNSEAYIKSKAHGTTTKTITKDEVRDLQFLIHETKEEQDTVEKLLTTLDRKIEINQKLVSQLEDIVTLLYSYWFLQFDYPDQNNNPYNSSGGKMVWNEELKREVPAGWSVDSIGALITEREKSSIKVGEAAGHYGKVPFFTSGDEIIIYDKAFTSGKNCFMNTGGNADVKYYIGEAAYSTDTWCITAEDYSSYLYEYINSIRKYLDISFFAGSGLKHLQKDAFKNHKILIPPRSLIQKFNKTADKCFSKVSEIKIENQALSELRNFLLPMLMNGQVKIKA